MRPSIHYFTETNGLRRSGVRAQVRESGVHFPTALLAACLVFLIRPSFAQELPPPDLEAVPDVPDAPMPVESGETMEPDITIIRKGKQTIQEYRINGELYMVKIIPDVGPPYYLIDTDGDGNMDVRGTDLERGIRINQWKLLEWN